MPGQGRLGDKASVPVDAHGCPACPHPGIGPAIVGSPDVSVNRRPALRVGDSGIHAACCGANVWRAERGSETVFINGAAAFRMTDPTKHCGGPGQLVEGSPNVIVGNSGQGAGRASRGSSSAAGSPQAASPADPATTSIAGARAGASSDPAAAADAGDGSAGGRDASAGGAPGPGASAPIESTWIEIRLIGEDGSPVVGQRYVIKPATGSPRTGVTDGDGRAKVVGLDPGTCTVAFPDLDSDAWHPTGA